MKLRLVNSIEVSSIDSILHRRKYRNKTCAEFFRHAGDAPIPKVELNAKKTNNERTMMAWR